jgi:hypothetical protein
MNNLLAHISQGRPEQGTFMDLSSDEEHEAYLDGYEVIQINSDEPITEIDMVLEDDVNFPFTLDDLDENEDISSIDGNTTSGNI